MFITLEDETDTAKLIVWPSLFEKQRRVIMVASLMACRGRLQSVKGVVHVVAEELIDQSELLPAGLTKHSQSHRPRDAAVRGG